MTETKTETFPPVVYVLIAVFLWSTGGLFIKLTTLDAYQVTFFRSLLAGLTVAILTRKQGLRINAFGILTSIIYATLLFLFVWATKKTTAANAIFLQYTAPIYILVLAPFVIGEKFHWRDLVTVIFCIGGMSLFFVGKLEISDYQGNIAALFSGLFLGLYIMLLKHPSATGDGRQETRDKRHESEPEAVATGDFSNPQSEIRNPKSPGSPPCLGGLAERSEDGVVVQSEPGAVATGSPANTLNLNEQTSSAGTTTNPQSQIPNPKSSGSPPCLGGVAERSEDGVVVRSEPGAVATGSPASAASLREDLSTRPQEQRTKDEGQRTNAAIAVIYGNFLLAILCASSGITALPIMTPLDWFSVSFLGIVQIGISYILFIRGVTGGTRPLDASIIGFIEPLLNPVWVFLFVGERPSGWAVLGGAIIITTVAAHTLVQYRRT